MLGMSSAIAGCEPGSAPDKASEIGRPLREVVVDDVAGLRHAVEAAKPGDRIVVAPGRYETRIRFNAENSGTPEAPIVLMSRDGPGTAVIDGAGTNIVVKFVGASHIQLDGLDVTGGGYHGVFFEEGAHHITLTQARVYDNHQVRPMNSHAEIKGSGRVGLSPHHIEITESEIFHTVRPPGGNFQGIDCNFCSDFLIADNYLHDIGAPTEENHSHYDRGSCIQMKSSSTRTVIERNRIARCHIGVVYGGEGMASPGHVDGIVRNNLIHDSGEIGIAVVSVQGGKVYHNTLFANPVSILIARDVRNPEAENQVDIANNVLGGPVRSVGDAGISLRVNPVLGADQAERVFKDLRARTFELSEAAESLIDRATDTDADVVDDIAGIARPVGAAPDIGAYEYQP